MEREKRGSEGRKGQGTDVALALAPRSASVMECIFYSVARFMNLFITVNASFQVFSGISVHAGASVPRYALRSMHWSCLFTGRCTVVYNEAWNLASALLFSGPVLCLIGGSVSRRSAVC